MVYIAHIGRFILIASVYAFYCSGLCVEVGRYLQRSKHEHSVVRSAVVRRMRPLLFTQTKNNAKFSAADTKDDTSLDMSEAVTSSKGYRQDFSSLRRILDFYKEYSDRESVSGFTDISELINGRLAMIGLVAGYTKEYFTGETLLQQIGIGAPRWESVTEISEDIGAATLVTFFVVTISVFNMRPPSDNEKL